MSTANLSTIGQNAFYYTLGSVISRAASLALLPIYTSHLSTSDYGVMELLGIAVDVAAILFVSGMNSGLQRYYFLEPTEEGRNRVVSTTFWLEIGLAFLATIALILAAPYGHLIGLRDPGHIWFLRLAAITFFFGVLSSVPLMLIQSQNRARTFLVVSVVKLAAQIALNLLFLVRLDLGIAGILYTGLIVNLVMGLVLAAWMAREVGLKIHPPDLARLRAFGVPYQITVAGSFLLVYGDRFVLGAWTTTAEVGLYGLAYQFGFLVASLTEVPFIRAWNPIRYALIKEPRADRDLAYNHGLSALGFVLSLLSIGVLAFTPFVLGVLTPEAFHSAARLVPVIVGAYIVQCYTSVVVFGIDVSTRTKFYTIASWAGAITSIALYVLLIPRFGGAGAAWATLFAFLVRHGMTYHYAQRLWPVHYAWRAPLLGGVIFTVSALVQAVFTPSGNGGKFVNGFLLSVAATAALWFVALSRNERTEVRIFLTRVILSRLPPWSMRTQ